jgi:hypothetical protein
MYKQGFYLLLLQAWPLPWNLSIVTKFIGEVFYQKIFQINAFHFDKISKL